MHKHIGKATLTRRNKGRPSVLVAGGAGFLGSHLCEALLDRGCRVVCLDNFYTGRASNVIELTRSAHFEIVEHDVVDPLPAGLPEFDEIYNLACPASPPHYQADPLKTAMTCAWGTMNLLERARKDGAKLFLASTSEVYGDPDIHPQPESYFGNVNMVGPRACYDEGKRFAETLCIDYGRAHGVPVKIVRIFNTYGPRMRADDGRVVSNFIVQAIKGEPITIYGRGDQTRSFCYVDDLIAGFLSMMETPESFTGPVNLGNPAEITVAHLARVVLALTGSESQVVYRVRPVDDPCRRRPDISLAGRMLGWEPETELLIGLENTIDYFRQTVERLDPLDSRAPQPAGSGMVA
ncbi:SDR family oxidoreductase [Pelagibacterium sp. 26DY04]|uniref:UDP-glucuronic acid decarboxylase family protein n=1 Tax=Pelagibacterium sp. 26DY04 TaxID=2967130 RepID=UPI00281528C4|nr:SDR family oxidoreductase [Pelagibacterium sp. 26DY04]WMT86765.1 SDR family oxidoreductase [Pelagibacterium sp. 26DY04]